MCVLLMFMVKACTYCMLASPRDAGCAYTLRDKTTFRNPGN